MASVDTGVRDGGVLRAAAAPVSSNHTDGLPSTVRLSVLSLTNEVGHAAMGWRSSSHACTIRGMADIRADTHTDTRSLPGGSALY